MLLDSSKINDGQKIMLEKFNCLDQELTVDILDRVLADNLFGWFIEAFFPDFPTYMTSAIVRRATNAKNRAEKKVNKEYALAWHKQGVIENKWVELRDKRYLQLVIDVDAQYQKAYQEAGKVEHYEPAEPADQRLIKKLSNREVMIKRAVVNMRYQYAKDDAVEQANEDTNAAWVGKLPAELRLELFSQHSSAKESANKKARSKHLQELLHIIETVTADLVV